MRWGLAALLAVLLAACSTNPAPAPSPAAPVAARTATQLTTGWQFRFDDSLTPEAAAALADADWQTVALPHTWNRLGEYRVGRTGATDNRQGKGWYRLRLDGSTLPAGKRHVIEFDAVGNLADLWVGGRHVGSHAGAFSRFRFDLTDFLDKAGPNTILLRADNSAPIAGSTTQHIVPLDGDFFIHGGIYRPARLLHVAPSHIALDDHGGPGVYATPTIVGGAGKLAVRVKLTGATAGQSLVAVLRDGAGRTVAEGTMPLTAQQGEASLRLDVAAPRRWNGRPDPYLYRLETRLADGRGAVDSVTVPVGFREFRVDPANGFYLNGKHLPLHGVSRHQDYLGKGWALAPEDHARDMALIAEMGANTVRFAHYQHASDWFDLADRTGMIVWAEVPFVNRPSNDGTPGSPELVANAKAQMIELIRQNYNHPSVVTWGIGNEVDLDVVTGRAPPATDARPLLRELNALSKAEDPTRPTVLADCCEATHEGAVPASERPRQPVLTGISDLMGYNRYYGWYYREIGDLGPHLDRMHARYPAIPISISEYGAGGALSQHVEDGATHKIAHASRMHPEEFQNWYHEQSWPQLRDRPYLWANWIWNMFDFSSKIRQEGDATDINDKGLVTYDRKVKKDAFFYYKAEWSTEPVVHITSRRWMVRSDPLTKIRVYSNAPAVAVTLNGKPLGNIACVESICEIKDVGLTPGANRVVATARFDGRDVSDNVEWTLTP
ncbi:beta-galactosidase [Sphingopyxis fribergensis]|uniref:Beta-galactosidase n=1 Tax=Sphingopyxis fribergensis TaxID=1515612 RepID=A0A0A7PH42_9SPHN|nr:glycoside hydrolase family 2 TIM barrel-domain containing protein [Sphingopyxis fribergensis]AJA09436.1 beta-galactosidase [Sphingopyxis fribergensis]